METKIFIIGSKENFETTLKFLPSEVYENTYVNLDRISEFLEESKNLKINDRVIIMSAGLATPSGFIEYFNVRPLENDSIVSIPIRVALEAPNEKTEFKKFKKSQFETMELKNNAETVSLNFLFGTNFLLKEIIKNDVKDIRKTIIESEINVIFDTNVACYIITKEILNKFEDLANNFNRILELSSDIQELQGTKISSEKKATMIAEEISQIKKEIDYEYRNNFEENRSEKKDNGLYPDVVDLNRGEDVERVSKNYIKRRNQELRIENRRRQLQSNPITTNTNIPEDISYLLQKDKYKNR